MSYQMDINVLREIKNNMNKELNKVRGIKGLNDITIEFDTTVPTYNENGFINEKKFVVNWTALGDTNPEETIKFAETLKKAAEIANFMTEQKVTACNVKNEDDICYWKQVRITAKVEASKWMEKIEEGK